ncbi:hypothetical protein AA313_de0209574 [Arthrobotrys entomopaga]|nr:hypothetical protein AA313_de0209574 [Arthrobotrys entomopaga]
MASMPPICSFSRSLAFQPSTLFLSQSFFFGEGHQSEMLYFHPLHAAVWATSLMAVLSSPTGAELSVRGPPGVSALDIMREVRRSLSQHSLEKRAPTTVKNSTSMAKRWTGATLLKFAKSEEAKNDTDTETNDFDGSVDVVCKTCYLHASMTASATVNGVFNLTQDIDSVRGAVNNVTNATLSYIQKYATSLSTSFDKNTFDLADLGLPPIPVDFNIATPQLPGAYLTFEFDGFEIYLEMETVFSAGVTYAINLFSLPNPIGLQLTKDLFIGVVPSIDLILSADSEINISSGFHIKFDDGFILETGLFANNATQTTKNGGTFEFLPVTVESAGVILKAVIRLEVRAGYEISTAPLFLLAGGIAEGLDLTASSGIEVSIWADIAELSTNVTVYPNSNGDNNCKLEVEESYNNAVGGAAGATVAIAGYEWGPSPETSIPIWGVTFTQCAISGSPTSSGAAVQAAEGSTTTTLSTAATYVATQCVSTGLINCPVSLQSTTKVIGEETMVAAVASGSKATYPPTTESTVGSTSTFGTNAQSLFVTSGPSATGSNYSGPGSDSGSGSGSGGSDSGSSDDSKNRKIILGVCIGLGGPILIAIVVAIILWQKRKGQATGAAAAAAGDAGSYTPEKTTAQATVEPTTT